MTAGETLKESSSVAKLTNYLEEIHVFEQSACKFAVDNPGIAVISCSVDKLDVGARCLHLHDGRRVQFDKLCICTGAVPRPIATHPHVLTLRDLESVDALVARLRTARHVAIVGNGGIAMELVHALSFCRLSWVVKDGYLGSAFLDATAAVFLGACLRDRLQNSNSSGINGNGSSKEEAARPILPCPPACPVSAPSSSSAETPCSHASYALGPEWVSRSDFLGRLTQQRRDAEGSGTLQMYLNDEVAAISSGDGQEEGAFPVTLQTVSGAVIACDLVISATGVHCDAGLQVVDSAQAEGGRAGPRFDENRAVCVDGRMEACPGVYAAGDCCNYAPELGVGSENWHQMRLWAQARIMGRYAAQCMRGQQEEHGGSAGLTLFAHLTRFFGFKVVLLGRFNAQGLGDAAVREVKETDFSCPPPPDGASAASARVVAVVEHDSLPSPCLVGSHTCLASDLMMHFRLCPGHQYIKVLVQQGRVIGAILLGDTDLEEVFENLILNGTDVGRYGADLLSPAVDLEDFFD